MTASKLLQSYVQYGSPKMFMKKSDSERALVTQDRLINKHILVMMVAAPSMII